VLPLWLLWLAALPGVLPVPGLCLAADMDKRSIILQHQAYVWQRVWDEPLQAAVRAHGPELGGLIALAAQVDWADGRPTPVRVKLPHRLLVETGVPVGLALRIGAYRGPFGSTNLAAAFLSDLCRSMVAEAGAAGLQLSELQIDYDCSESNLPGYAHWLQQFRRAAAPVRLTFTALPAWLHRPAFADVAGAADGFVLQVHSLQRPAKPGGVWQLCDPALARSAVDTASRAGRPFRIALPTYGYLVAQDEQGRILGVAAEEPRQSWPPGSRLTEVWANPLELAVLVGEWTRKPPANATGILWYRFPSPSDDFNWRWPTLRAIIQSRIPRRSVRVESRRVEAALTDLRLLNEGELDISSRLAVTVRWQGSRLVAADALGGFELVRRDPASLRFESRSGFRLRAGEACVAGWVRLGEDREVRGEIEWLAQ